MAAAFRIMRIVVGLGITATCVSCTALPEPNILGAATAESATVENAGYGASAKKNSPQDNLLKLAADVEARGSVATALPLYERAAAAETARADVHVALANAYAKLDRHDDAANAYRRALKKEPKNTQARFGLGTALVRSKQIDVGLSILEKVAPEINSPLAFDRLGVAHIMAGQPREALASFEQALNLDANDPDIAMNVALAAALLGQKRRAATILQSLQRRSEVQPYHRRNLVLGLALAGKAKEAEQAGGTELTEDDVTALIKRAEKIAGLKTPAERAQALGTVRVSSVKTTR